MFRKIEENLSSSNAQPLNPPRPFPSVAGAEKDGAEHSPPLLLHLRAPLALIPSLHASAQCRHSPGRNSPLPLAGTREAGRPALSLSTAANNNTSPKIYLGMATIYIIHLLQTNCCANAHYIAQSVCNILYQILSILQPRMSPSSFTTVLPTARVH